MSDLQFKTLYINNFKSFRGEHKLTLNRKPGLYLVAGNNKQFPELGGNGVGKSTLIADALFWCAWGKTIRDKKPGAAIVPWSGEKNVEVRTTFIRDGDYELTRSRNPNKLTLNDVEISQDEVANILGVSEEMFRRTIILGQFGTLFLDMVPEQQAAMFSEALDLDIWLDAADAATKDARKAEREAIELQATIQSLNSGIVDLTEQIKAAGKRADEWEDENDRQLKDHNKTIADADKLLKAAKAKLRDKPKLPTSGEIEKILDEINAEPDKLEQAEYKIGRRHGKLKTCPTCKQTVPNKELKQELEQEREESRQRLADLHAELKELQAARKEKDADYQKRYDAWQSLNNNIIQLQNEVDRLEREKERIASEDNIHDAEWKRLKQVRKDKRDKLDEATHDLDKVQWKQKAGEFWTKGFKEIRLNIIDEVLVELEIAATRHAGLLGLVDWGIKYATERETTSGNTSYKFTVMLYPPDQGEPIKWESYCGGEVQRWQNAAAFALSEVLLERAGVQPNIEIIDEQSKWTSPVGISDMLEHLHDRAVELGRAIYLIDHHALDRGAFDGMLMVTKDRSGSSFKWL
jgi:DNA repair exonuclease SbcCD ATPase subunit